MKKLIFCFLIAIVILGFGNKSYSQKSIEITTDTVKFIDAHAIYWDVYIKNNGTVAWAYSSGAYAWTFNSAILNGLGATLEIVPGFTDPLLAGWQPPSVIAYSTAGRLRTSGNSPGAGPTINPGVKARIIRLKLTAVAATFAAVPMNFALNISLTPSTHVYFDGTLDQTEFTGPNRAVVNPVNQNDPAPVELASFTSNVNLRDVKLLWSTSMELNNAGFDIERKLVTASDWSKAGYIAGRNTASSYTFEDRRLNTGKYNYRLKQIDNNGNIKYYSLANEVEVGVPTKFNLSQNYPNPFNPVTKIDYDLPFDSKVHMVIFDISGRELMTLVNEAQTAGYYTHQFNASSLSSGTYFYRLEATGGTNYLMTKKMVLIK
jgi:hypothetical protein